MRNNTKGSAMVLVLISILILSIIGIVGLSNISTDLATSRNFAADKTAFYAADAGINVGLNMIRNILYPPDVQFLVTAGLITYKSGKLEDSTAQPVRAFKGFASPPPRGIAVESGSELSVAVNPWQLDVSSQVQNNLKGLSRKEITLVVQTISSEY